VARHGFSRTIVRGGGKFWSPGDFSLLVRTLS
jgi:hypothetical protein